MTQTSQLDLTRPDQRGVTIGLNEFAGYAGVALGGLGTAYLAGGMDPRQALLLFGLTVAALALLDLRRVQDTLPWAQQEAARQGGGESGSLGTRQVFWRMSWGDRRLAALSQAGLVEKFVDALVWVFYPVFLYGAGLSLPEVGWVTGVYGVVWGVSQLLTGRLSDRVGRQWPNVLGMWVCGLGVALMLLGTGLAWWSFAAAVSGLGMALLYPNLSAAVADLAHPSWRGSAIGIYRFWRDLGYSVGALGLGLTASVTGQLAPAFWFVAGAMFLSGLVLLVWGEESHPRLRAASGE
ncbi:MFS transporter [Deinococcus piscis]|nr:MFS transporter [Deinococcus piscis]